MQRSIRIKLFVLATLVSVLFTNLAGCSPDPGPIVWRLDAHGVVDSSQEVSHFRSQN